MSQKLLNRWKKLSNDFTKNATDNKPTIEILKEAIELQRIAGNLEMKIHKNSLSKACMILKESEFSIGTHTHTLNRKAKKANDDGSHRHVFILPDGSLLMTEEGGNHSHAMGFEATDLITESGSHSHEIILPDGSKITTLNDSSEHDHQLKVMDTCFDGIHSHSIKLGDGTVIDSMWGGEYWEYLNTNGKNLLPAVVEDKTLAQQLFENLENSPVEINCLNYFDQEKVKEWCKDKTCFAQKIPDGVTTFISKNSDLVFVAGTHELLSDEISLYFNAIKSDFTFEVVLCKDESGYKIYLLDVINLAGTDMTNSPYSDRIKQLNIVMKILGGEANQKISLIESRKVASISQIKDIESWITSDSKTSALRLVEKDCKNTPDELATKIFKMENKPMPNQEQFSVSKENLTDELVLILAALGYDPVAKETEKTLPEKLAENCQTEKEVNATILKSDDDKRLVTGVVLEPMYMDLEADIMTNEEVEGAAHRFLKDHRVIGFRHKTKAIATVVESYIAPIDFELNGQMVKKGSWIITVFVQDDELWRDIKSGFIQGFSVGGFGQRTKLT
jgi:hypothetical protein